MDTLDRILTVKETADYLKLTPLTVYDYIRQGTLRAIKFGRYYRIQHTDLLKFIDEHVIKV
jgi:excisionase family DNA binding protein